MPAEKRTIAGLECVVLPPSRPEALRLCVVLCHGFGAPGTDLVPLAFELINRDESFSETVQFVFPAAPLSLDEEGLQGGRAWWHLDVNSLVNAIARGEVRVLRNAMPDGLADARDMVTDLVETLQKELALPPQRIVLGGFSQGAMVATDVTLHMQDSPAALAVFSGTLLCESVWRKLAPRHKGLRVVQSHGRYDMILPFAGAEWLRDMFRQAGLFVDFVEFAGDHTIPVEALTHFAALLRECLEAHSSDS